MVAAHQIEVGRRQHGERHAGIGQAPGGGASRSGGSIESLVTWPIATRPPQPKRSVWSQTWSRSRSVGIEREVEMQVEVGVELAGQREQPVDLAVRVAVGVGRAADDGGAAAQGRHHQLLGAGIVEQPFLREDAELEVDRPAILGDQRQHALQPAQADARVDLDVGAHPGGAVQDAALQRPPAPARARPRP